jgi:outer membrane murein-binding lipoprotein Lpp
MSKSVFFAGALGLVVAGCASSGETERRAQIHEQQARQAASYEDYDRAAQEKHEAQRLHAKAANQRVDENYGEPVAPPPPAVPPDYVPPPPPAE